MKPNILCIVMDDLRADFLSAFGGPAPETPHMDRMVERGCTFRNQFVTTPICTPGRAELLTGCRSWRNGVPWFQIPIDSGCALLPRVMCDAGYHTVHVGKWHNDGHPKDRGYTRTRRVFTRDCLWRRDNHYAAWKENGKIVSGHTTELYVDAALEEIEGAPQDRPWFTWLAPTAPHDPFLCPEPFQSMYDDRLPPLPDALMPAHPFETGDLTIRDETLLPWPRDPEVVRRYRARYWAIITHLDYHLGRLFDRLEATGRMDDTIVVITGDHGLSVGDHGLLGKSNMYDHSCRVPATFVGPGVPRGTETFGLTASADLMPTLCALAEVEAPSDLEGRAVLGTEGVQNLREEIVCQMHTPSDRGRRERLGIADDDPRCRPIPDDAENTLGWDILWDTQRCIRTDTHKLHWYPLIGRFQLFDLQDDPHEKHDMLRTTWLHPGTWVRNKMGLPESSDVLGVAADLRERLVAFLDDQHDACVQSLREQPIPEETP
ncbi:MAG: sulfatase-like hydrolase/transferase [Candidatus Brocadiia bacterium]